MKVAILLLAAALGSASPVPAQNSIQARDGQNACDCSKPFEVSVSEVERCPNGYKDISPVWIPHCVQIGCSAEDHKAKCDAKPQDAKPSTAAEKPENTTTAPDEQKTCDCSKAFEVSVSEVERCPDGYKDISPVWIPHCVQIGCSAEDHKAKCDAKPQDAKPSTAAEKPENTTTAPDEQKTCDCSKAFEVSVSEVERCPDGYKDISPVWIPHCVQIGCSAEDHKAKCSSNNNNNNDNDDDDNNNNNKKKKEPATAKSDCQAPPQI
ncbi:hypothetical protein J3458_021668 [Metarhizium acridum]|uniref:uncharacterized protein n=1 Tax=Metarhizium acridum TaxID=92637 RepID=UPI001C6C51B2|nr:hypothetical protein J3458_021668 [Metarhizium acridum]